MKKFAALTLAGCLLAPSAFSAASPLSGPITDSAALFPAAQESMILPHLTTEAFSYHVVTVPSLDGVSPDEYAARLFQEAALDEHDLLLLIGAETPRQFALASHPDSTLTRNLSAYGVLRLLEEVFLPKATQSNMTGGIIDLARETQLFVPESPAEALPTAPDRNWLPIGAALLAAGTLLLWPFLRRKQAAALQWVQLRRLAALLEDESAAARQTVQRFLPYRGEAARQAARLSDQLMPIQQAAFAIRTFIDETSVPFWPSALFRRQLSRHLSEASRHLDALRASSADLSALSQTDESLLSAASSFRSAYEKTRIALERFTAMPLTSLHQQLAELSPLLADDAQTGDAETAQQRFQEGAKALRRLNLSLAAVPTLTNDIKKLPDRFHTVTSRLQDLQSRERLQFAERDPFGFLDEAKVLSRTAVEHLSEGRTDEAAAQLALIQPLFQQAIDLAEETVGQREQNMLAFQETGKELARLAPADEQEFVRQLALLDEDFVFASRPDLPAAFSAYQTKHQEAAALFAEAKECTSPAVQRYDRAGDCLRRVKALLHDLSALSLTCFGTHERLSAQKDRLRQQYTRLSDHTSQMNQRALDHQATADVLGSSEQALSARFAACASLLRRQPFPLDDTQTELDLLEQEVNRYAAVIDQFIADKQLALQALQRVRAAYERIRQHPRAARSATQPVFQAQQAERLLQQGLFAQALTELEACERAFQAIPLPAADTDAPSVSFSDASSDGASASSAAD